jgi:tRNA(Ser,Leu) C12 N-acetylase TAN1
MKGRAKRLLDEFEASLKGAQRSFLLSRLILLARVVPEQITSDTDDEEIERRIEGAIEKLRATVAEGKR